MQETRGLSSFFTLDQSVQKLSTKMKQQTTVQYSTKTAQPRLWPKLFPVARIHSPYADRCCRWTSRSSPAVRHTRYTAKKESAHILETPTRKRPRVEIFTRRRRRSRRSFWRPATRSGFKQPELLPRGSHCFRRPRACLRACARRGFPAGCPDCPDYGTAKNPATRPACHRRPRHRRRRRRPPPDQPSRMPLQPQCCPRTVLSAAVVSRSRFGTLPSHPHQKHRRRRRACARRERRMPTRTTVTTRQK